MQNAHAANSRSFLQILDFNDATSDVKTTRWKLEMTLPERAGSGVRWMYIVFVCDRTYMILMRMILMRM